MASRGLRIPETGTLAIVMPCGQWTVDSAQKGYATWERILQKLFQREVKMALFEPAIIVLR